MSGNQNNDTVGAGVANKDKDVTGAGDVINQNPNIAENAVPMTNSGEGVGENGEQLGQREDAQKTDVDIKNDQASEPDPDPELEDTEEEGEGEE